METNRDYLSWSQYSLWKSSKLQFYKRYVLGEKLETRQFDKGKEFALYKETGEIPQNVNDPMLEQVADAVPELDEFEKEIRVTTPIALDGSKEITLLSFIDSCKNDNTEFYEYKTGKIPWTQNDVDAHEQLDFYALSIYLKFGVLPKCTLYWIETEEYVLPNGDEELRYTGHFEKFDRVFNEKDIVRMLSNIVDVKNEIDQYEHVEFPLENDFVQEYIDVENQIKELTSKKNILRLEVMKNLEDNKLKYATSKLGNFSISERQHVSYPLSIIELENKYKSHIDSLKLKAQRENKVTISVSKSLRFSKNKSN